MNMNANGKIKSYRLVIWGVLILIYLIVFFQRLAIGTIAGDLKTTFDMTSMQLANLGAMYFYAYTIMQIPTGILADKLGPRITVVSGTILAGIASIGFSFSTSIGMAYATRLLIGVGVSVVFLSILKIISNWFPAENFATMSGITSFMGNVGGLLSQAPLVIIVGIAGWRGSFLVMGITTLVLAAAAFIIVKDSPVDARFPEVNPQQQQLQEESSKIFVQLFHVVKNPRIWWPSLAFGGVNGGFILFSGTFGISYLMNAYNIDKISASNIVSLLLVVSAFSFAFMGRFSDLIKRRKLPMVILASFSLIAWTLLLFADLPMWYIYVFVVLVGLSISLGVTCWPMAKEVSNPLYSGMAMSIVNVSAFLFAAVIPVISGKMIDSAIAAGAGPVAAYEYGFLICVACSVMSLIFAALSKETKCMNIYQEGR
ncbi:MAG: MFS transporter [Clostridiaceae bacterium]